MAPENPPRQVDGIYFLPAVASKGRSISLETQVKEKFLSGFFGTKLDNVKLDP